MTDKPKYSFAGIPPRAIGDDRLNASQWRVLAAVSFYDRFSRNGTGCYASQSTLASKTKMSRETVNRCLRVLEEYGYLKSRRSSTGRRQVQYGVVHELMDKQPVIDPSQVRGSTGDETITDTCDESVTRDSENSAENANECNELERSCDDRIYLAKQLIYPGESEKNTHQKNATNGRNTLAGNPHGQISMIEARFHESLNNPQVDDARAFEMYVRWEDELGSIMDDHEDQLEVHGHAERVLALVGEARMAL